MHKAKILRYIVILFLCLSFAGCAALQKKFVRKKKEEEKLAPVITMYDYSKDLRTDELYKKHFLFWKTWQLELIGRMDATYKKRNDCYDHIIANLMEMQRYLRASQREELQSFLERIKSIEPMIRKGRLSKSEKYRITKLLEDTRRQIEKKFSYSDVKDLLELQE